MASAVAAVAALKLERETTLEAQLVSLALVVVALPEELAT